MNTKIFTGYLITSEIRMHLHQSRRWQNASFESNSSQLVEAKYKTKNYIGRFLNQDMIEMNQLRTLQVELTQQLQEYCPQLQNRSFELQLFTHTFIA